VGWGGGWLLPKETGDRQFSRPRYCALRAHSCLSASKVLGPTAMQRSSSAAAYRESQPTATHCRNGSAFTQAGLLTHGCES